MRSTHQKPVKEWLNQARYDLETAEQLFGGGRFSYAVYFVHLALEKALKGLYVHRSGENPPVTHNLLYLSERTELVVPDDLRDFLDELNEASVLNLYPDRLFGETRTYDEQPARAMIDRSRETFDWITDHFVDGEW